MDFTHCRSSIAVAHFLRCVNFCLCCRCIHESNKTAHVSLVMAKTKVAPLKKVTVHCLELNGAVLSSKLAVKLLNVLKDVDLELFLWSDSKTALSWIRSHPGGHKQYITNRIIKIQESTSITSWRYVPTSTNPADVASRGLYPSELPSCQLWWRGPPWLQYSQDQWPSQDVSRNQANCKSQHVEAMHTTANYTCVENTFCEDLLHKFSHLDKLLALTAWSQRFTLALRKQRHEKMTWITYAERKSSLTFWIRYVQNKYFFKEISALLQNHPVSSKS